MATPVSKITAFLDSYLRTASIKDSSRNGLQVEGVPQVRKIGLTVDACLASFRAATEEGCQMLVCHHGIIWDGIRSITGQVYGQIRFLIENRLNLYASHLPLDLHPVVGNNIRLVRMLGLNKIRPFGEYQGLTIGYGGSFPSPLAASTLAGIIEKKLATKCLLLPFGPKKIRSLAVVSGGGSREIEQAVAGGYDAYLTGEPSHQNHHFALEAGIHAFYAGHYATETLGVKALGKVLEKRFDLRTVFLDIPTKV